MFRRFIHQNLGSAIAGRLSVPGLFIGLVVGFFTVPVAPPLCAVIGSAVGVLLGAVAHRWSAPTP